MSDALTHPVTPEKRQEHYRKAEVLAEQAGALASQHFLDAHQRAMTKIALATLHVKLAGLDNPTIIT